MTKAKNRNASKAQLDGAMSSHADERDALAYHHGGRPGKIEIVPTKPVATRRDLALAYTPGVAVPVRRIAEDAESVYDYTAKGNMVAVITNGSAILGLGALGALAAKPVMEGKAVLFKRFAALDAVDLELDAPDADSFIHAVRYLGPAFGGINLEDIKAPDCFIIEQTLSEAMDIPVFHDDQHGTAIIVAAGLINAFHLTRREFAQARIVINGAGAAAIACADLVKAMGATPEQVILCDSQGPITRKRQGNLNQWKSAHAVEADYPSLAAALDGADVFIGLSVKGALKADMLANMNPSPVIFALANPDPEIMPDEAAQARKDAIIATGRSDFPNQVNNVLGFPYIFRGALDVRARAITQSMKIAAARALAALAREDVPDEVAAAYGGERPRFGPDYIIPATFDPRLIYRIPPAIARAAMEAGVARQPIVDEDGYRQRLRALQDPVAASLQGVFNQLHRAPKKVVFAEGEEPQVIRAALSFRESGLGTPILIGRHEAVAKAIEEAGLTPNGALAIEDPMRSERTQAYADYLYGRLQRRGQLPRDCLRLAQDRVIFSACRVALGEGDAMIAGVTRNYAQTLDACRRAIDPRPERTLIGFSMILAHGRTVLVADTNVHDMPSASEIAAIAIEAARVARRLGHEPRVALLAYSTFGYPEGERSRQIREAVALLDQQQPDFEYDGEMAADIALSPDAQKAYPFCRLSGPANVLIMPAIHSASISTKLLKELGGAEVIGPMLTGLAHPVQIASMGCSAAELINLAAMAAFDLDR